MGTPESPSAGHSPNDQPSDLFEWMNCQTDEFRRSFLDVIHSVPEIEVSDMGLNDMLLCVDALMAEGDFTLAIVCCGTAFEIAKQSGASMKTFFSICALVAESYTSLNQPSDAEIWLRRMCDLAESAPLRLVQTMWAIGALAGNLRLQGKESDATIWEEKLRFYETVWNDEHDKKQNSE